MSDRLFIFFARIYFVLAVNFHGSRDDAFRFFFAFGIFVFLFDLIDDRVRYDTEDKRGSDRGDRDHFGHGTVVSQSVRNLDGQSTDTGDEDRGNREEVFVLAEVDVFEHLQPADCDESIERQAYAAHDTVRDRLQDRHDRAEEAQYDTHDRRNQDRSDGSVFRDSYATYGFSVRRVGADTEDRTGDGAYAVTEERSLQSGFAFNEVFTDDGTEVLVVCDVFREDNECYGDECQSDFRNACTRQGRSCTVCCEDSIVDVTVYQFFDRFDQSKVRIVQEALYRHGREVVHDRSPVDDLEVFHLASVAEDGEERSKRITRTDTDDERDKTHGFEFLLRGADDDRDERNETAEKCNQVVRSVDCGAACFHDVSHSATREGKSDQRDRRSDDNRRHEFGYPFRSDKVNHDSDHNVDETCQNTTDDNSEITECDRGEQRSKERERATDDNRALEFGEEQVNDRTYTCTEDCCGDLRGQTDDGRDRNGRRHNGKHLLQRKHEQFVEFWLIADVVN